MRCLCALRGAQALGLRPCGIDDPLAATPASQLEGLHQTDQLEQAQQIEG